MKNQHFIMGRNYHPYYPDETKLYATRKQSCSIIVLLPTEEE